MFADEVRAAASAGQLKIVDNWSDFWAACPLNRSMLVSHNASGSEKTTPERDTAYFQEKFFSGDTVGVVWPNADGTPRSGCIYRRLAPDTVEQVLRLGPRTVANGIRRLLWDLGIRHLTFQLVRTNERLIVELQRLEAKEDVDLAEHEEAPLGPRYRKFTIHYKSKPAHKDWDFAGVRDGNATPGRT